MKKLIALAAIALFASCSDDEWKDSVRRIEVLENGSISYVTLNAYQQETLRPYDTVWVNLYEHEIDDISDTAMLAVIVPYNQYIKK